MGLLEPDVRHRGADGQALSGRWRWSIIRRGPGCDGWAVRPDGDWNGASTAADRLHLRLWQPDLVGVARRDRGSSWRWPCRCAFRPSSAMCAWNDRSPTGFTALGLAQGRRGRGRPHDQRRDLSRRAPATSAEFDAREPGYAASDARAMLQPVSWLAVPIDCRVLPIGMFPPTGRCRKAFARSDCAFPILQSYVDVVVTGGLEYGPFRRRAPGNHRGLVALLAGRSHAWVAALGFPARMARDRRAARGPPGSWGRQMLRSANCRSATRPRSACHGAAPTGTAAIAGAEARRGATRSSHAWSDPVTDSPIHPRKGRRALAPTRRSGPKPWRE